MNVYFNTFKKMICIFVEQNKFGLCLIKFKTKSITDNAIQF